MPKWRNFGMAAFRFGRLLDWRPIRQQAQMPLHVVLMGTSPALDRLAVLLEGGPVIRLPLDAPPSTPPPDLVVLGLRANDDLARATSLARELDEQGTATLLLAPAAAEPSISGVPYVAVEMEAPDADEQLETAFLEALPEDRRLAAGRRFPPLRPMLARQLVQEAAFANAQFALVTNLPSLLPGPGTAAGMAADMVVLTTNQVVLVYRLAAAWGQSLDNPRLLLAEITPVVGGAFLWRTAARTLTGLLPMYAAVAPRIAVAYIGTYVVGGLASAYYERGLRPSERHVAEIEEEARRALGEVWARLRPQQGADAAPVGAHAASPTLPPPPTPPSSPPPALPAPAERA